MTAETFSSTTHCQTSAEFIANLSPRSAAYPSAFPRAWIFRGLPDDSLPLVPTALRGKSEALTELTLFPITTNADQIFSEREVLKTFLQVSDSIGLNLPEDTQTLRRWLELPAKDIKVWQRNELLSLMALAQHHGIPKGGKDYTAFVRAADGSRMADDPLCEVGCPFAVRGFDYDYTGILWLNDLLWRHGHWTANLTAVHERGITNVVARARNERALRGPANAEVLQRTLQAYRILLTRALRGIYLWIPDEETRQYIRESLDDSALPD